MRTLSRHRGLSHLALLAGILALARCSHGPQRPEELRAAGRDLNLETIAILGTNDLHGALAPLDLKSREPEGTALIPYQAGGVATLNAYVNELRAEFGTSLLWLDGGDEFQGSIDSNLAQGEPMLHFLNDAGLQAAAIGNHEFDYGASKAVGADPADRLGALKARMTEARFPYLAANIRDKTSGALATSRLPLLGSRKIFDTGRVKVGVIGLTTLDTPRTTTPINVKDLTFSDLVETTRTEAAALRESGADIVIIVGHVGLKCERGRASAASHVRAPTDPQGDCGPHDELVKLLKKLPPGTVDAVVAGHTHQVVHHWVEGIPVIEGGAFGRYFNVIYLNYDLKQKKLMTDLTRIEGPVPVCPKVFQNQNDCNGERPAPKGGRGSLVTTTFHGADISPDHAIQSMLAPTFSKSSEFKNELVATAARPIDHERFKESEIGDIITDAMRSVTGAKVALMNSGGIRAPWEQGPIPYEAVFRTLPFDNLVVPLHVTGRELKLILRIAESGSRGFFSVSGVRLRLISPEEDAKGTDLNGDGKVDAWEINRTIHVEFEDGSPILDDKTYTLATLDFLINGGDDLGWIMAQIPASRQEAPTSLVRDAVVQRMKSLAAAGPLNSADHPILDPANPRIKFEKTKVPGKGRSHRRRRKKST